MIALRPGAWIYGGAIAVKNRLYERKILRAKRLAWPVVSVGNISVGGSGKTPVVIALVEEFARRGIACDVLSRGYGRRSSGVRIVDAAGTAEEFGDEPLLIARRTGVPVVVGSSRYAAGVAAEALVTSSGEQRVHILDDGFQHRELARDFDLVLIAERDLEQRLLPEGCLREPVSSLLRADALGVTQSMDAAAMAGKPQWKIIRSMRIDEGAPGRPIAFCGIARPQQFFAGLKRCGIEVASAVAFRDHHGYAGRDVERLQRLRESVDADGFLTTEKDMVRLGSLRGSLEPISAVRLDVAFENADGLIETMLATIRRNA